MNINGITKSLNNVYFGNNPKVMPASFQAFVSNDTQRSQIPLNISKAYATPQLYPEYKVLDTFKLPNTGVGKLYQLRNGHKVAIIPKKGPTVINTYVKAGWSNQKKDKKAVAHILEHLLATIEYKKLSKMLQDFSDSSILYLDASTNNLYTKYSEKALVTNEKERNDLMKYHFEILNSPDFSDENFKHEQTTIINEEKYRNDKNDKKNYVLKSGISLLFNLPEDNLFNNSETPQDIYKLSKDDVLEFHKRYYRPDNMVTTIVGNVDENTIKMFSKYFNKVKNPILKNSNYESNKLFANPIQKTVRKDIINPNLKPNENQILLDFLVVDNLNNLEKEKLLFALNLVKTKLYEKLDDVDVSISPITNNDFNKKIINISGNVNNTDPQIVLQQVYDVINELRQTPVSQNYLDNLKKTYETDDIPFEYAMNLSDFYNLCMLINNLIHPEIKKEIHKNITPSDLQNIIKKYLDLNKTAITVAHPKTNKKTLSFKSSFKLTDLYQIKEYVLPNNIKVNINESDSVAQSSVSFLLTSEKPLNFHTCANKYLRNAIFNTGIKQYSNKNGIIFNVQTNQQNLSFDAIGPKEKTFDMIDSVVRTLYKTDFTNEQNLKEWKKINKNINKSNAITQKYINEFYKDVPWLIQKDDVQNLTLKNVQDYSKELINNSQVSVNITIPKGLDDKYKNDIFQLLSKLPNFKPHNYGKIFNMKQAQPLEKNKVLIDVTENSLMQICKDYKFINTGNIKDIAAVEILNLILGDSFDGMLFKKLRQEKNITYSANTNYNKEYCLPNYGIFSLSTYSDKNNLQEVVKSFDECIKKLQTELVSDRDLNIAKKKLIASFLLEGAFSVNLIGKLFDSSFYGQNYMQELENAINNLTAYDIRELAKYYLSQPSVYLISGNKESIESNKDYLKTLGEVV